MSDSSPGDRQIFEDRDDAGRRLAAMLAELPLDDPVVLGLPRGGVPIAAQVARALHAPLDVLVVRKLGVPWQPEVAMGAIGEDGVRVLDEELVRALRIPRSDVEAVQAHERSVLEARVERLRAGRASQELSGRTALVVDDGIATGATARAACEVARAKGAIRIVVAAPVGAPDAETRIPNADAIVCVTRPERFRAVSQFYRSFDAVSDDEVTAVLAAARRGSSPGR
ncbi:MAG: putative phosphoribosyltransferase [Microbacterium sp.]|nr:putative phosphoribosyltransferase [Microbacterium sp.]